MSSNCDTDEGFYMEEDRRTHHDDQENILEVFSMAESVGDEKGKISLQQL